MVAKLLCRIGRHKRSASRCFVGTGGIVKSRCRTCGTPMVRDRETGSWMVSSAEDSPTRGTGSLRVNGMSGR